ncbi:MAG: hypothetical protein M3P96_04295 [Actinomycetota bacterium]|nr:hypothetical protein [Actinomycetota bacterium]
MKTRKAISAAGLVVGASAAFVLATPGTALATHTHVMQVGSGQCVVLAEEAGEESVLLPAAVFENNPNVDIAATAGRTHPLHVLVHKGAAGDHRNLYVLGTQEATKACGTQFVNR